MTVKLVQETNYPWDGEVKLTVTPEQISALNVCLRIPGWALGTLSQVTCIVLEMKHRWPLA